MKQRVFGGWLTAVAASALVSTAALAQTEEDSMIANTDRDEERVLEHGTWYPTLEAGFNLTQSAFSDNWYGGDKGSIVWTFLVNSTVENQLSDNVNFFNVLRLAFGQTQRQEIGGDGTRDWGHPEKSTDSIDYEGLFRFTLGAFADPFIGLGFASQFQDASDPSGRTLTINPMTFKQSAGLAKQFINKDQEQLISRLGFAVRENIRSVFTEAHPSTVTENATSTDGGLEWVTDYATQIFEDRVSWTSRLSVYQPVFYSAKDDFDLIDTDAIGIDADVKDFTTEANIGWENLFSTQITKLISVNMYLQWLYDKYDNTVAPVFDGDEVSNAAAIQTAIRKKGQFKQTLALGLTYRFF